MTGTFWSCLQLCLSLSHNCFSQAKSNLEIFYFLADSSVNIFVQSENPHGNVYTEIANSATNSIVNSSNYAIFNNHILGFLQTKDFKPITEKGTSALSFYIQLKKYQLLMGTFSETGSLVPISLRGNLPLRGVISIPVKEKRNSIWFIQIR